MSENAAAVAILFVAAIGECAMMTHGSVEQVEVT